MTTYRFSTALGYSHAQLADMFSASFQGYYFSATLTAEGSAEFWRVYQIDAMSCLVMHDEQGTFVGMARLGVRGARGWCGGFGIVPAFRGTGASTQLAAQMVQVARERGLHTLQLEVLTQNLRAIKLYEATGFVATRRLIGLEAAVTALPTLPRASSSLTAKTVPLEVLLPMLVDEHTPWHRPERELASLLTMHAEAVSTDVAASGDGRPGGMVFRRSGDHILIQAAFFQSQLTTGECAALLRAAAGAAATIQVYNEPENSPLLMRYQELGFHEFFSQYEMLLTL